MSTSNQTPAFKLSSSLRMKAEDADASPLLSFSTREQYLAWVAAWRETLADSVQQVRQARAERGDKTLSDYQRSDAASTRQGLRVFACNLFALRAAGKRLAAAQVAAQRLAEKQAA